MRQFVHCNAWEQIFTPRIISVSCVSDLVVSIVLGKCNSHELSPPTFLSSFGNQSPIWCLGHLKNCIYTCTDVGLLYVYVLYMHIRYIYNNFQCLCMVSFFSYQTSVKPCYSLSHDIFAVYFLKLFDIFKYLLIQTIFIQ